MGIPGLVLEECITGLHLGYIQLECAGQDVHGGAGRAESAGLDYAACV